MLMKRLMNWRPLVKSLFLLSLHYTFVTRRWKDLSLFHYWVQHFPTWFPLAIFVIIFTHIDNLLQVCRNFIILASFDAYKTIKAIEISCRKAFAYSELIKRKLYCWKKKKFVPKREGHWIIKLLELYCTKKTEQEHESKYKRKVANIFCCYGHRQSELVIERDKIVNPIFTSDFRGANQVHFAAIAAVVYYFSSLPKLL